MKGTKTSYYEDKYLKYLPQMGWGYFDTITLMIDKTKGNFGLSIGDKWKGWAYENEYAIQHKELYLSLNSYGEPGCEIEILNKDMITPERLKTDYTGIKNKKFLI